MPIYKFAKISLSLVLLFSALDARAALANCGQALLDSAAEANDPMPKRGAFAGQNVENIRGRTLKILSVQEKQAFGIDPTVLAFANFRHAGQFYIAHIPGLHVSADNTPLNTSSAGLKNINVISEHWEALTNPGLGDFEVHSYVNFNFVEGQGIRLDYNQTTNAVVDSAVPPIAQAVLSIEALRPQSQPNAGLMPSAFLFDFAIGHLFFDKADRDLAETADAGKVVEVLPLNLAGQVSRVAGLSDPKEALLYRAIYLSQLYGRTGTYNFVVNNCTNGMFALLDSAVTGRLPFDQAGFVANVTAAVNADIPQALTLLKATVAANGKTLPPSLLTDLNNLDSTQVSRILIGGARDSQNPSQYQTWFPLFVKAHLSARGLITP